MLTWALHTYTYYLSYAKVSKSVAYVNFSTPNKLSTNYQIIMYFVKYFFKEEQIKF